MARKFENKKHQWESINKTMQYRCKHCGIIRSQSKDGLIYQDNSGKNSPTIPDCIERIDYSEFYK